jgi:FtsP/CotA-like multicopper oxidase with cupredoxin domain
MGGMMGSGAGAPLFDAFAVNGKTYPHAPPLIVRQGERVRLRLVNAGATQTQVFALAGHALTLTHADGNPLVRPVPAEAVLLGVGERADVEFVADHPGRWRLRSVLPDQFGQGLGIDVVYEGHEGDPVQDLPPDARLRPVSFAAMAGAPHAGGAARTYELTLSGASMGMRGDADTWTINGRSYPDAQPIAVRPGERVRLRLSNMSMLDHPMHLHGHSFQIVAIGGQPVDGPIKDTLTIRHMEQYEVEFVAADPGTWLFHCHNLVHMAGGLMAEVRYG